MAFTFSLFFYQILITDEPENGEERPQVSSKQKKKVKIEKA